MTETVIIGAGPAGLAVGACLRRAKREFVILDRAATIGWSWRHHYECLRLHTVRRHSALPYRRFPRDWPTYLPREQVVAYLEDYARAFALAPRLGETVTRAAPFGDGWRVETSADVLEARSLVIATGYNAVPHRPRFAGEERFAQSIVHSAEYRNAEPYRERRVLVVGAGNTGAEIALDLCEHGAASVDLCIRGPIHIVRRDLLGVPSQVLSIATAWIPVSVRDVLFGWLVALTIGDLSRFGIRRPGEGIVRQIHRLGRIPIIDTGTVASIQRGHITVRPDIRDLGASSVSFVDGASAAYDAIVLATGFRPCLDAFLERAAEVVDERGWPRRFGREAELPGLYFVGFHNAATGLLREIGREAKRVAKAIVRASR
jgi:cation diffusion facilitator CzcD-associated flavoprotein CzcO